MKHPSRRRFLTAGAAAVFTVLAANGGRISAAQLHQIATPPPFPFPTAVKPVIGLDLDIYFDIDDVGDVGVMCGLAKNNEITIGGCCIDSTNVYSAPCTQALLTYSGFPNVPIGAYQGSGTYDNSSLYTQQVAATFGQAGKTRADYPDTLTYYKAMLSAHPDQSVVLVLTGLFSNLAILWADATARALLVRKVAYFVLSAGEYPIYLPGEFNIKNDAPAAAAWFAGQTTIPTYLLGLAAGALVQMTVPGGWDNTNPYKFAFNLWGVSTRSAWGSVCLMFAARGTAMGYQVGFWGGNNVVDPATGANTFSSLAGVDCGYIETAGDIASRNVISAAVNALLLSGGTPA